MALAVPGVLKAANKIFRWISLFSPGFAATASRVSESEALFSSGDEIKENSAIKATGSSVISHHGEPEQEIAISRYSRHRHTGSAAA